MAPKQPTASYSTFLRARRHARQGAARSAATVVQVGNWAFADEEGSLVIINRTTGSRTLLMRAEDEPEEPTEEVT